MIRGGDQFTIRGPKNVVFGRGSVATVGDRAADGGDRVLVVTDPGVRRAGLIDDVLTALERADLHVEVFEAVTPDPDVSILRECTSRASESEADVIVGVGGGSPMDVAKAAALTVETERPIDDLFGRGNDDADRLPTILLPTTSGTGSEVSTASVLYDDAGDKQAIIGESVFADTALVDPDLSSHLPMDLTRATGLDAFSHAIGSYVSTTTNTYADALTGQAMELIEAHLRDATYHGADAPVAREKLALAATMAMLGRVNGGKAAIHAVAYGLQEMYDLPHGEAIAMVLPEVVEYTLPAAVDKVAALGGRVYDAHGTARDRAQAVVDGLYRLRRDVGLDRPLRAVADRDDLDDLAAYAVHSKRHIRANPRDLTQRDARDLLAGMW